MSGSTAEELFIGELRDVCQVEKQLVEALPKLVDEATHPAMKATLTHHLKAAEAHVERLVEAIALLDGNKCSRHCEAEERERPMRAGGRPRAMMRRREASG
jgi:ferritin-like metal-binding protein YciE